MAHPGAVAYGKTFPELRVQTPVDGAAASVGNGKLKPRRNHGIG